MLTQIYIRNFAIIDELELDIDPGMTVLTGETGAGKSILVDALGLVLGERANSDIVRHGASRADIGASFDITTVDNARQWLIDHDLDEDRECVLRRVITREGRTKAYINGSPVPVQNLRELGAMLVDIHGQHQHQSLLNAGIQRELLDDYAENGDWLARTHRIYHQWKKTAEALAALQAAIRDRNARLDILNYHIEELETLALGDNELSDIEREHKRLANGEHIQALCANAINTLSDDGEADLLSTLQHIGQQLEQIRDTDPALSEISEMIDNATIQLQESANALRRHIATLEPDPQRLTLLDQRLGQIHELSRKHRIDAQALPQLLQTLVTERNTLLDADIQQAELDETLAQLITEYGQVTQKLTQRRRRAAKRLGRDVSQSIKNLGMPHAQFNVTLTPRQSDSPHIDGMEHVNFEITNNPGQPPKLLAKVASGGELSRVALAIQVLLSSNQKITTLIFDEVDTGIGGAVAETVGRLLRTLGETHQVMCVTHLPQVAALGHHHMKVTKHTDAKTTHTGIVALNGKQREDEIARMLGGMEITPQTRAHATEMIHRASRQASAEPSD